MASYMLRTPESAPQDPPRNISVSDITTKSFSFTWESPAIITGRFSYKIQLYGPTGLLLDNSTKDMRFSFANLDAFTTYRVCVSAETTEGAGPESNITIVTLADVPSPVVRLQVTEISATSLKLRWSKPHQPNGIITQYRLQVFLKKKGVIVQDIIITGKVKDLSNSTDTAMLNKDSDNVTAVEAYTYHGSAEMTVTSQTVSSLTSSGLSFTVTSIQGAVTKSYSMTDRSSMASSASVLTSFPTFAPRSFVTLRLALPLNNNVQTQTFSDFTREHVTASNENATQEMTSPSTYFQRSTEPDTTLWTDIWKGRSYTTAVKLDGILSPSLPTSSMKTPANSSSNATEVAEKIYYITDVQAENVSYEMQNLLPFTEYTIKISAFNYIGEGPPLTVTVKTSEQVPSSVRNVSYQNLTSTSVLLSWIPPINPNGQITHYTVYALEVNTDNTFTKVANGTTIHLTGLRKYTYYSFRVSASTAVGESVLSEKDDIFMRTLDDAPSSPPRSLSWRQLSPALVKLSWKPPIEPNGIILYYTIYLGNIPMPLPFANTSETSLLLTDLENNREYYCYVTASTWFGDGSMKSETIKFKTSEGSPSDPPGNVNYENISSSSINITWTPPLKPNGIIKYYTIYYENISGLFIQNVPGPFDDSGTLSASLTHLAAFSYYSLWITASTALGDGNQTSDLVEIYTDEDAPETPPIIKDYRNLTATSVLLSWKPPQKPNGVITSYELQLYGTENRTVYHTTNDTIILNLLPFRQYNASLSAWTKKGLSPAATFVFYTDESVPETPPIIKEYRNLTATSVLLSWKPPLKPNGIIMAYELELYGTKNKTVYHTTNDTIILENLLPFRQYTVSLSAWTKKGLSPTATFVFHTDESAPSAPSFLKIIDIQATSVTLQWTKPVHVPGRLQNYTITTEMMSRSCTNWEKDTCTESQKLTLVFSLDDIVEKTVGNLKMFRWYRLRVTASTNAGYGEPSSWTAAQTLPGPPESPPQNVVATATSYHSINVTWNEPAVTTGPTAYFINITMVDNASNNKGLILSAKEDRTVVVTDLKPFTNYSVTVTAFVGDYETVKAYGKSSAAVIVTTLETFPTDPPSNLTFQKIQDEVTKFQVTFLPPSEPNGKINVYQAAIFKEENPEEVMIQNISITETTNKSITAVIKGLKGGNTYNISVYAVNGAGSGPRTMLRITMDISAPPFPDKRPSPAYDKSGALLVTATTISVPMPLCFFSDNHGPIKTIQIIVSDIGGLQDGNVTNWHDANFNKARPYFTNDGFSNPVCTQARRIKHAAEIYTIGAENTCLNPENENKICNGPLKPRKQYIFKFRATNVKGQFTDSAYSDPVKTLAEGLSSRTVEIILAVTLCVLSIILLITAIFVFTRIRQKQKEGGMYSPHNAEITDTKFKLNQMITMADLGLKEEKLTWYSTFFFKRKEIFVIQPVNKKYFPQHIEELCSSNNLKFQEEFVALPKYVQDLAFSDADLPWNQPKNRFANIKPYNNNRVKLILDASCPGSDYINASYVSGYLCPNEFIATQGPLPGTVGDFWRMIFETRAKSIVMLTQCFEKGRIRCHQYWPEDNKPMTVFGDIIITKLQEDAQTDWTVRVLKTERNGEYLIVHHFNFTSWPEHGVPENTASLINFVKMVRSNRTHDNTPIVVHCSAGVGRTGVFIALDNLIQHLSDHDFIDIYGIVAEMRRERMCMVQNLVQYMFLHQCALDLLTHKGNSRSTWFVNYSTLQKMDSLDAMEGDVELEWEETTM